MSFTGDILKNWLRNQFKAFGYSLIPTWRMNALPLSSTLHHLFDRLDIRCVLDVGANKGQYRDFLRQHVEYQGLIISFEPVQENVKMLQERAARDHSWFVCPYALGNTNSTGTLNVMKSDLFSSFHEPDNTSTDKFHKENTVDHVEHVEIKRLDDIIDGLDLKHELKNIYLKLDTQGHDLEVFSGSNKTLSRVMALQSEVSVKPIYKDIPDYLTAVRNFNAAGFDIAGFFPVSAVDGRIIEFDCVMINNIAKYSPSTTNITSVLSDR